MSEEIWMDEQMNELTQRANKLSNRIIVHYRASTVTTKEHKHIYKINIPFNSQKSFELISNKIKPLERHFRNYLTSKSLWSCRSCRLAYKYLKPGINSQARHFQ